jgi:fructose-1,6-bisphosphatase II / sedoheptulose-1,7-bisphosphatase
MTTLAIAPRGTLLHAPDIYMDKIAVGAGLPENIISLTAKPADNILAVAKAKHVDPSQIGVCILDRPRHAHIIESIRSTGARIVKITDGDVGAILTADPESGIDIYMGSGGAPEGVLAAAALKAIGGQMFGRLIYENDAQKERAKSLGIKNPDDILSIHDMVKSDCIFAATGVTTGSMIKGIYKKHNTLVTETFVANSFTKKFYRIIG